MLYIVKIKDCFLKFLLYSCVFEVAMCNIFYCKSLFKKQKNKTAASLTSRVKTDSLFHLHDQVTHLLSWENPSSLAVKIQGYFLVTNVLVAGSSCMCLSKSLQKGHCIPWTHSGRPGTQKPRHPHIFPVTHFVTGIATSLRCGPKSSALLS